MKSKLAIFFLGLVSIVSTATSHAATIIDWTDSGWYQDTEVHNPTNTNYIAGLCSDCGGSTFRNFFVFDTSAVAGTVTSATLRLRSGFIATDGVYNLYDVITPIASLVAGGTGLLATYEDLGSGVQFGTANLAATPAGRITIDIPLNASAIAAINASTTSFAIGGHYTSQFHAFGGTNTTEVRQLIIETAQVPVPGTVALIGLGLLGLASTKRYRSKQ